MRTFLSLSLVLTLAVPLLAAPPGPASEAEVLALIARAGVASDHGNAPCVVVLDETDVHVRESGLALTESRRIVKILTDAGVREYAVLRERFDPSTYRVSLDAVRIRRADGSVEDVDLAGVVTQPTPQGMIFWGGRQLLLALPRVAVGDCVEVRTRRIGYNIAYLSESGTAPVPLSGEGLVPPMEGQWFEVERFEANRPILRKRYSVHLPAGKPLQFQVVNGPLRTSVRRSGDTVSCHFVAEDVPAFTREPSMQSRDDCVTKVVLATVPTWEEKSRWFFQVNKGQFEADDAIRAKVAEITEGLPDEEARIAACLHWVADHIRYYGTSRGPREGFTLHTGIETFRDRGGVCKDIAGMLITMLRAMDLPAFPALTMAGPRVEEVPADQFNHTVCALRRPDGSFRFLDPTWSPVSRELWSSREALQGLVPGTPEGATLMLSPYFPPERNALRVQARSRLVPGTGELRARLRFDLDGYPCTYFRRNVNRHRAEDRLGAFEEALGIAPNLVVRKLAHTDPFDYSRPSHAEIEVAADGYAIGTRGLLAFRLPLLAHPLGSWLIPDLTSPPKAGKRRYGMRLRASRQVEYRDEIALPPGSEVLHVPADVGHDSPSGSVAFSTSFEDGKLAYELTLRVPNHIVPPGEYEGFRKALAEVARLAEERVVVRVTPLEAPADDRRAAPAEAVPDAVIEEWEHAFTLEPDGTTRRRERRVVRLNTRRPIGAFADTRIDFREGIDEVVVHAARTLLPDGTVLPVPDYALNLASPRDVAGWPRYAAWRQRIVSFSGICAGAALELDYEVVTKAGADPWLEADLRLDADWPVAKHTVTVTVPGSAPLRVCLSGTTARHRESRETTGGVERVTHRYELRNLPATPGEKGSTPWETRCARFLMTTCPDPATLAGRWLGAGAEPDEAVARFARETVKDERDPEERARLLAARIKATFHLHRSRKAWAAGGERTAGEVLEDGYGSPRDAAVLLAACLRALGHSPVVELAVDADRFAESAPTSTSLASAVVRLDVAGETLRFHPLDGRIHDRGAWSRRRFLSLVDGECEVAPVRAGADRPDLLSARGTVRISKKGKLAGEVELSAEGEWLDPEKLRTAAGQRGEVERLVAGILSGVKVVELTLTELGPGGLSAKVKLATEKPLEAVGGGRLVELGSGPACVAKLGLPLGRSTRRTPVAVAPIAESVDLRIELPRGWTALGAPRSAAAEAPGAEVRQSATVEGGVVRWSRSAAFRRRVLPAADLSRVRDALDTMRSEAGRHLLAGDRP